MGSSAAASGLEFAASGPAFAQDGSVAAAVVGLSEGAAFPVDRIDAQTARLAAQAFLSVPRFAARAVHPVAPKAFLLAHLEAQLPHPVAGLQDGAGLQIPKYHRRQRSRGPSCPQGPCQ